MPIPRVPLKPPENSVPEDAGTAERMLPVLRDLERRATAAELPMLAYLIDLAIIEAERNAKASDGP